jgi:hypothetical protein
VAGRLSIQFLHIFLLLMARYYNNGAYAQAHKKLCMELGWSLHMNVDNLLANTTQTFR